MDFFQEHEFDDDEAETQSLKVHKRVPVLYYLSLYCCIPQTNPEMPNPSQSHLPTHFNKAPRCYIYFRWHSTNIVCTIQLTLSSSECSAKKGDLWEKRHNSDRPPNGQCYCKEKVIQTPSALWNPHNKSSSVFSKWPVWSTSKQILQAGFFKNQWIHGQLSVWRLHRLAPEIGGGDNLIFFPVSYLLQYIQSLKYKSSD